jgi:hypothetical protein
MLVGLAGCPGPAPGDDEPPPDAPPVGDTALHLEWRALPMPIPGPAGAGITIERVRLDLKNLQVVGDGGVLSRNELELDWESNQGPERLAFENAQISIYSRIELQLSGHEDDEDGVEIRGRVMIGPDEDDFEIDGIGELDIGFDTSIVLMPGDNLTQVIEVDFAGALQEINFGDLPSDEGRRVLRDGDPQLPTFRAALRASFAPVGAPSPTN